MVSFKHPDGPQPRYLLPGTVRDAAIRRINWLWDEFDGNVVVCSSGGKDSTVAMELALEVARARDALPLRVFFLDQECEYQATVDMMRRIAARPEIQLDWYQIPFRLQDAVGGSDKWLHCWDDEHPEVWMREKEPDAITVNDFGTDRFGALLSAIGDRYGGAALTGVRAEESPARRLGLTSYVSYKWVTWGKKAKVHKIFHPIYDWSYRDVWKSIYDGGWDYNACYEAQYMMGRSGYAMRVSSLTHDTAIQNLFWLQEFEPDTWTRLTKRLEGVSTAGHLGLDDYWVHELPYMFRSWQEYHGYLVDNLIDEPSRGTYRKHLEDLARRLPHVDREIVAKFCVRPVLSNDSHFTQGNQFYLRYRTKVGV